MCAVFSKEILKLTWWPLFRDSTYYIFSLGLLALFFGGPTVESQYLIEFWEALILFLAYVGYVMVMKFNVQLQKKATKCFGKCIKNLDAPASHNGNHEVSSQYVDGSTTDAGATKDPEAGSTKTKIEVLPSNPLIRPAHFRAGVLQMVLKEQDPQEQIRVKVVAQIVGDVHTTFSAIDADGNDTIDKEEFRELIRQLTGGGMATDEITKTADDVFDSIDLDGNLKVSFNEFKQWYLKSETRVMNDVKKAFDEIDVTEDGFVKRDNFKAVVDALGMTEYMSKEAEAQAMHMFTEVKESKEGYINFEQFISWYRSSMLWEKHTHKNEEDVAGDDDSEGLDISWPSTGRGRLTYIIWAPIILPLAFTIPDCRYAEKKKFYLVTFVMSIVWVAVYSYFMVWWATLVGNAAGISDYIMGLTILAAGTSVPDLLTSVIVARQGHGDMAVSSSIGSNIFDITVGLPVPWMLSTIIRWTPQIVRRDDFVTFL
jgi:K+-dependent Na+/Ca+ exchanger-like protein